MRKNEGKETRVWLDELWNSMRICCNLAEQLFGIIRIIPHVNHVIVGENRWHRVKRRLQQASWILQLSMRPESWNLCVFVGPQGQAMLPRMKVD